MKLTDCPSIKIGEKPYTLVDMTRFVVRNDRRYNRDASSARQGARTIAALEAGADVAPEDVVALADVLERPSCGWGAFSAPRKVPQPDGSSRELTARVHVPALEFLPIVDFVQQAAASVAPLLKPAE